MQYKFKAIIKPSLYAGIEYLGLEARRWYPEGPRAPIVVDPAVNFGHPIVRGTGVPTETLYASYLAEGKDRSRVARLYEVTPQAVSAAVRFEGRLRKAICFDNNLPPPLAHAIASLSKADPGGVEVIHLKDRFPQDAEDTDWIPRLGREGGWISSRRMASRSRADPGLSYAQLLGAGGQAGGQQQHRPGAHYWRGA